MSVTHIDLDHLDAVSEFSPALRKWIKFRLDCEISEKQILSEIHHASRVIMKHVAYPPCQDTKSNKS